METEMEIRNLEGELVLAVEDGRINVGIAYMFCDDDFDVDGAECKSGAYAIAVAQALVFLGEMGNA